MSGLAIGRWLLDDRWRILIGTWLLSAATNAFIIVPASVFPVITRQLDITSTAAGWSVSVVFGVAAIVSIPAGIGLDRTDDRLAIAAGTGVLVTGSVLSWWAAIRGTYWGLLGARALGGIAFPIIWNAGVNLIGRRFPPDQQATAIGVFTASAPVGFAVAQFSGPLFSTRLGWEATLGVFGLPAGLAGLVFWYSSRRPASREAAGTAPGRTSIKRVLTDEHVRAVGLMGFLAYSIYVFFNTWMPSYLTEHVGLSLQVSGMVFAAYPAIGVVSRSGSGFVSDRFLSRRRRPVMYFAFAATLPLIVVIALTEAAAVVLLGLVIGGFALQSGISILHPYVQELADPQVGATAVAVLTTASFVGSVVTPVITGALIDGSRTYLLAFGYAGAAAVAGVLLTRVTPEPRR